MSATPIHSNACERVRRHMDSYISGELLVETNEEVLRHLGACTPCLAAHDERLAVRDATRRAVRSEAPPADLALRVRARIHGRERGSSWRGHWKIMTVAAALLAAIGAAGLLRSRNPEPVLADLAAAEQGSYISSMLEKVSLFSRGGLHDHLHCTMGRKYPRGFPPESGLTPRQKLTADWSPLQAIAARLIPSRYTLLLAHRCSAGQRRFVHFTYVAEAQAGAPRSFLSVMVSARAGSEKLPVPGIVPALETAGVPVYAERSGRYSVASFPAGEYTAWVVSDLPAEENRLLASNLAPPLAEFLRTPKTEI
ncbi:MAG: zf-HC2 domain-containing protein [Bryobacteraceae bacterium]